MVVVVIEAAAIIAVVMVMMVSQELHRHHVGRGSLRLGDGLLHGHGIRHGP
jgi:hypothetical protein